MKLVCPSCSRVLYKLKPGAEIMPGEVVGRVRGSDLIRVGGVHEPARGVEIECPEHGVVDPRTVRG